MQDYFQVLQYYFSARPGQDMDKPLAMDVLKTKSENFTIHYTVHELLFTDYCSQSLFTFIIYGTVHSEFLPI